MPKKTTLPSGEIIFSSDNSPDINPESLLTNPIKDTKPSGTKVCFSFFIGNNMLSLRGILVNFKLDHQLDKRLTFQFTTTNQEELIVFVRFLEEAKKVNVDFENLPYSTNKTYVPVYFEMPGVNDILELVLEEKN